MSYRAAVKTGVVFADAKNKKRAKEFVTFLLQDENLTPYVEGSLGRWYPVTKSGAARLRSGWPTRIASRCSDQFAAGTVHVRIHQELQVHDPQQRERLGQGGEPRGQRQVAVGEGGRRDDRAHQGRGGRERRARRGGGAARPGHRDLADVDDRTAADRPVGRPSAGSALAVADVGPAHARPVRRWCSWCSCCTRSATACGSRAIRRATSQLFDDPIFCASVVNTLVFLVVAINVKMVVALFLSGFFITRTRVDQWLSVLFILPWAVPSIPTILSLRFMLNPEWGVINPLIFRLTGADGPNWLNDPLARARHGDARAHLEGAAVLDADPDRRRGSRSRSELYEAVERRRRDALAEVQVHHVAVDAHALPDVARSCR